MVVFRIYLARSGAGRAVAVGSGVFDALGWGVIVATGVNVAAKVAVGAGEEGVQDVKIKTNRKRMDMDDGMFFRMGSILPLLSSTLE